MLGDKDLLDMVGDLNASYYDISRDDDFCPFVFESCGYTWGITFMDEIVWNSEEDLSCNEDGSDIPYEEIKNKILYRSLAVACKVENNIREMWDKNSEEFYQKLCFPEKLPKPNPLDLADIEGIFEE